MIVVKNSILDNLIVVKRSGQRVNFNGIKIAIAIKRAFDSTYGDYDVNKVNKIYETVLNCISENYQDRKTINVEDIQDIIEKELKNEHFEVVYKSFNTYRKKRKASREVFIVKQQHKFVKAIEGFYDIYEKEKNNDPNSIISNFGKAISIEYAKSYILESKFVRAHEEGNIYIHDLEYYPMGIISSSHLNLLSFTSDYLFDYIDQLISILFQIKVEQYGEQTISSLDYLLEKIIIKEFKIIFKNYLTKYFELWGFNEFIDFNKMCYSINNISAIYFDLSIFDKYIHNNQIKNIFNKAYKDSLDDLEENIYINLKRLLNKLNDLNFDNNKITISLGSNQSKEAILINNIYFKIIDELKINNVETVIKISKDSIYLEQIAKLIALNKKISLNFSYSSNGSNYIDDIEYFSDGKKIENNVFDSKKSSLGRMVLSETSINLARLGLKYDSSSINLFYKELEDILEMVKNQLLQRFEIASSKYPNNYKYLFKYNVLLDSDKIEENQKIRKILKNGTLNINIVGLGECAYKISSNNYEQFMFEVLNFINEKCQKYSNEFNLNFVCEEICNCKILKEMLEIDKSIYGSIKNITDKPRYNTIFENLTNEKSDVKKALQFMSKIQSSLSGGICLNITLPLRSSYKKVLESIFLLKEYNINFARIMIGNKL